MKIVSPFQMKEIDSTTIFKNRISSLKLIEHASFVFVKWFINKYDLNTTIYIFCGPGNNGSDGYTIGRSLIEKGYNVRVFKVGLLKQNPENIKSLAVLKELIEVYDIQSSLDFPKFQEGSVIVDAIFGAGLRDQLQDLFSDLVDHLNFSKNPIIALDIATGLFADQPSNGNKIIKPLETVSFQLPKLAFLMPENHEYVGDLTILDIGLDKDSIQKSVTDYEYFDFEMAKSLVKKRGKFSHKGDFGRSLIIGGSYGMIGAVTLACKACYTIGAGLVRAFIPSCGYNSFQSSLPEAMVLTDVSQTDITTIPDLSPYDVIGIGPGMSEGQETEKALELLLQSSKVPLVIDAGALNILGKNRHLLKLIPENSVLTPHPKEFERLTKKFKNDFEKLEGLKAFAKEVKSYVLLKGAYTAIAFPDGKVFFNSSGNSGMAKGGSGDVLTGIITGLFSQTYKSSEAALLGVYIHGYAGDSAVKKKSQHSILASDIIEGVNDFYRAVLS